jgi:hypothetical protein
MSETIYIDRVNMERRMGDVVTLVDELDSSLGGIPSAADGGTASALIGFIASAGAEAANEYGGAVRLIDAITTDVLADASLTEEQITEELTGIEAELDG